MKKILTLMLLIACLTATLAVFASCNGSAGKTEDTSPIKLDDTTPPQQDQKLILILSNSDLVLGIGESKKLTVKSSITGMETSGVLWTSMDPSIATVDTSGNVKGVSDGTTTVKVTSIDGEAESECIVTVASKLTSVKIEQNEIVLVTNANNTASIEYEIAPANLQGLEITWQSLNENVVKVSQNGVVTAVGNGTTSVMVTVKCGDVSMSPTCTVRVITTPTSISFDESMVTLTKNVVISLSYTLAPQNISDSEKALTWTSKDESVVSVLSDGRIKAVGAGTTTVTVKTSNGIEAKCLVTVVAPVENASINPPKLSLRVGQEKKLEAIIYPADASNKEITWSVTDESVATVTQDGTVIAKKVGTTVVKIVTEDGNHVGTCELSVVNPLESITLDKTELNLPLYDGSVTLIPTFTPFDAEDLDEVSWSSKDPKVATVDQSGVVTPVGPGTTTITIANKNGVFAECIVTVPENSKIPVTSIELKKGFISVTAGESIAPNVTVLPADATDKSYIFESSDSSIIRVNPDGTLSAISAGTAIITVSSASDPEVTATLIIEVTALSQDKIDKAVAEYKKAIADEESRHLAALATIENSYSYAAALKNKLDTEFAGFNESVYNEEKAKIEKAIADYTEAMGAAESTGNATLVEQYSALIKAEQDKLAALNDKWTLYDNCLTVYTDAAAKRDNEIKAENEVYTANVEKINTKYTYILPYINTPDPTPDPNPDSGNGGTENT